MPLLDPTQYDFVAKRLKIRTESLADSALKAYLSVEAGLIVTIDQLRHSQVPSQRITGFEAEVLIIQASVQGASNRDGLLAASVAGRQALEDIRLRVVGLRDDAQQWPVTLQEARATHRRLLMRPVTHPVLVGQSSMIQARILDPAVALASQGHYSGASARLANVLPSCKQAYELARRFDDALARAREGSRSAHYPLDKDMIDEAYEKASEGDVQAALGLIARAEQRCRGSRNADVEAAGKDLNSLRADLMMHSMHVEFAKELAALGERLNQMRESAASGIRDVDKNLFGEQCQALQLMADQQLDFVEAFNREKDSFQRLMKTAVEDSGAIEPKVAAAIHEKLDLARRLAANRSYAVAQITLLKAAELTMKAGDERFGSAYRIQRQLEYWAKTVARFPSGPGALFADEASALRKLLEGVKAAAAPPGCEYAKANGLLAQLKDRCDALDGLMKLADDAAKNVGDVIGLLESGRPDAHEAAVLAASKLPLSQDIPPESLAEIRTLIEEADKDHAKASAALHKMSVLYKGATKLAGQRAAFERGFQEASSRLHCFEKARAPILDRQLPKLRLALERARKRAEEQDHWAAMAELDSAMEQVATLDPVWLKVGPVTRRFEQLRSEVSKLTNVKPRWEAPLIGMAIPALDERMVKIGEAMTLGDPPDAVDTMLDEAETRYHAVKAAKIVGTPESDDASLRDVIGKLAACGELDRFVLFLPRTTPPKVVLLALRIAFNLDTAVDEEASNPDRRAKVEELKSIYRLLASVPRAHVAENECLKHVRRNTNVQSFYYAGTKTLALGTGHENVNLPYELNNEVELPGVLPACVCKPGAKPTRLDFTTLHEIGHAVDDQLQYMQRFGHEDRCGSWRDHGSNVLAISRAAHEAFGYPDITEEAIYLYISRGRAPDDPLPENWSKVRFCIDRLRYINQPWMNGKWCGIPARSGGYVMGGRIYHEATANRWVSYAFEARKEGITGYQFRAPGEWFSELYAAYKCCVLRSSHPAMPWLREVFGE